MFRKAVLDDIDAIGAIYDAVHTEEEAGRTTIGWSRHIYPTHDTALSAIALGDMFVLEEEGTIVACGRINKEQVDCYAQGRWQYDAPPEEVMVLHTLVVDPSVCRNGYGTAFLQFYEDFSKAHGCSYLRIDTNERNIRARAFYEKHGYREVGTVPCEFNGIPGVGLVLLEKKL
ncbi:MAG: GNAT family N-acetyltransferase [Oscillospiraceae bacterium]|nr:GNAT family N-acetyltransferase [Oscillospiraceae bacterium]